MGQGATLEPLGTQDAALIPLNHGEFRLGVAYAANPHTLFQTAGRHRKLSELPALSLNLGLGERVEAQLSYAWLRLREDQQRRSKWRSGDLTIAGKIRLRAAAEQQTAYALRFATKLPNADDELDLGTDETDVFIDLLASRRQAGAAIHLNLGLGILGDPGDFTKGQDDLLHYALATQIGLPWQAATLLASVEGLDFGKSANQRGAAHLGLQLPAGRYLWDLGGSLGYTRFSEDWSLRTGITTRFDLPQGW